MPQHCLSPDPDQATEDLRRPKTGHRTGHHHGGLNINTGCWQQADHNLSLHNQEKQNQASSMLFSWWVTVTWTWLKGYKSKDSRFLSYAVHKVTKYPLSQFNSLNFSSEVVWAVSISVRAQGFVHRSGAECLCVVCNKSLIWLPVWISYIEFNLIIDHSIHSCR